MFLDSHFYLSEQIGPQKRAAHKAQQTINALLLFLHLKLLERGARGLSSCQHKERYLPDDPRHLALSAGNRLQRHVKYSFIHSLTYIVSYINPKQFNYTKMSK